MLLYQTIRDYIQNLINQGELEPNSKLPSERDLQTRFSSTRITVRDALLRLEAEGLIYRQNRKGWFVCPPRLVWDPVKKANYYELVQSQGFNAKTQLLHIKQEVPDDNLRRVFSIGADEPLHAITRVRYLDQRAVLLEQIYCRVQAFPELHTHNLQGSLTEVMAEDYGVEVNHEKSQIYVTTLGDTQAPLLGKNSGVPCLKIIRQRYNRQKELVDYNLEYWLHSAIEIKVEGS